MNYEDNNVNTFDDNIKIDPNFQPQQENIGFEHPIDFSEVIQFGMRYQMSVFVMSAFTNLVAKAYGIDDPNLLTSPHLMHNSKGRVGKTALDEHAKKVKGLVCLKVATLAQLQAIISKHFNTLNQFYVDALFVMHFYLLESNF